MSDAFDSRNTELEVHRSCSSLAFSAGSPVRRLAGTHPALACAFCVRNGCLLAELFSLVAAVLSASLHRFLLDRGARKKGVPAVPIHLIACRNHRNALYIFFFTFQTPPSTVS